MKSKVNWPKGWKELTEADGIACVEQLMFNPGDGTIHLIGEHETMNGRVLSDEEYGELAGPAWKAAPGRGQLAVEKTISRKEALFWLLERFLCTDCLKWDPLGKDAVRVTLKLPRGTL